LIAFQELRRLTAWNRSCIRLAELVFHLSVKSIAKRFWILLALTCVIAGQARAADWLNAGPLFDEFSLTLAPGHRTEALGPLFYSQQSEDEKIQAVPPLFSLLRDSGTDSTSFDLGYPIFTYDRFGTEYRWQLLQLLSFAGGENQREQAARRFTIYPFYFQQRSTNAALNYTAFAPFYGHLKHRLMRDEIYFVMFPFYSETRKKDVVTDNYLYPFFDLRHGDNLRGWQFWPFVGHEHKGITTETNGFGDVSIIGGHDNRFILWPFYLNQLSGIGTENPQKSQAVLPLYSITRSPQRDSTTVIWPFFTHTTDREKKYSEWDTPWPLIVFARGEGKTTSRVWPFFSHAENTNLESAFYLWPVYKYNRVHGGALDRERTRILLFLYSDTILKNTETGTEKRRVDFWPFFTHWRDHQGRTRLQVLSILEPILPNSASIERDYSPVWSLWRSEKNPKTHASSQSLLWNLYRRDTTPDSKKCSLFFGLFQYQSSSGGKQLRLLYIPVGKTKPTENANSK
jgi:hypothetical protein